MKAYLLTGACGGIGKAIFKKISNISSCILIDKSDDTLARLICENEDPDKHIGFYCNLSDLKGIQKIFELCKEKEITILGLIHCAGISRVNDTKDIEIEEIVNTFSINTFSFIELSKQLLLYDDLASDCRIIGISSIAADRPSGRQLLYASSKAALNSAILSIAQAGLSRGIRANILSLGAVDTTMLSNLNTAASFRNNLEAHYPLGVMNPDDIAEIVVDLLSPKYKNMTGSVIKIDSGFNLVH